jgi:hypothetical protein
MNWVHVLHWQQYKNPLAICYDVVTIVIIVTSEALPLNIEVKYHLQTQYNVNKTWKKT